MSCLPCLLHAKIFYMFHCFSCSFAGLSFLTPVIGFYCQKCEEFIGDLNSADNHAAIHCSNHSSVSILPICVDIFFHFFTVNKSHKKMKTWFDLVLLAKGIAERMHFHDNKATHLNVSLTDDTLVLSV